MNGQDSKSHHYVPEWHQRRFLPATGGEFFVLDKSPATSILCPDGKIRQIAKPRQIFRSGPHALFQQEELYSVIFPQLKSDVLERHFFGLIDDKGAKANQLFCLWPKSNGVVFSAYDKIPKEFADPCNRMIDLIEFIDIQKSRTPKGIAQLKLALAKVGHLAPNNTTLMSFLMARRQINCTIWAEAVWEIFSAKSANVKFLISDDPVAIYNCDCYPESAACRFPHDPDPFWIGSRVLYPLSCDSLLVLSHVEHVDNPSRTKARRPRRNARSYDEVLISYTHIVNQRELNDAEVRLVNHVIKTRAARYVASTCQDDLFPETAGQLPAWCQIDKLFHSRFPSMRGRSETLIRYADDSILYTNAFGERDLTPSWFVRSRERDQAAPTKDKV